jgi:hypothetical protein
MSTLLIHTYIPQIIETIEEQWPQFLDNNNNVQYVITRHQFLELDTKNKTIQELTNEVFSILERNTRDLKIAALPKSCSKEYETYGIQRKYSRREQVPDAEQHYFIWYKGIDITLQKIAMDVILSVAIGIEL